jgi:hypothetical protein
MDQYLWRSTRRTSPAGTKDRHGGCCTAVAEHGAVIEVKMNPVTAGRGKGLPSQDVAWRPDPDGGHQHLTTSCRIDLHCRHTPERHPVHAGRPKPGHHRGNRVGDGKGFPAAERRDDSLLSRQRRNAQGGSTGAPPLRKAACPTAKRTSPAMAASTTARLLK